MSSKSVEIHIPGREFLKVDYQIENDQITAVKINVIGGLDFLELSQKIKRQLAGPLSVLEVPVANNTGEMLWREAILKIKGLWQPPYTEELICFCRSISSEKVHLAILSGGTSSKKVSDMTSTSTGCGTCRPDVEALIKYRMGS